MLKHVDGVEDEEEDGEEVVVSLQENERMGWSLHL